MTVEILDQLLIHTVHRKGIEMDDKKCDSGFPVNGSTDELAAWASKVIGSEPLLRRLDPIPAPVSATVARIGAHLDRLVAWVLRGVHLEGVLLRLSSYPRRFATPQPKLDQSAPVQKQAPSHKG